MEIKRKRRQSRVPVAPCRGMPHSNLNSAKTHFYSHQLPLVQCIQAGDQHLNTEALRDTSD